MTLAAFGTDGAGADPAVKAAGPPAPDFSVVTADGGTSSRASLAGRPALLIFWAPWCRVCQRELPRLAEFARSGRPAHLRLLAIGFADTRANVEAFVKARAEAFAFPTAYDEDNRVAEAFQVTATPTLVLLDGAGSIVLVHRGGGLLQNSRFREFLADSPR
jgi:thiol-disulfide isomerase/thioredoxin